MAAIMEIPPLKPATFRWHPSPADPNTIQRVAVGTEQWVGIKHENAKGQYDNYLNTTLCLQVSGLSLSRLKTQLAAALVHLRFEHPEVAATAVWEEDKPTPPTIQYTAPVDNAEALEWAHSCISVRTSHLNPLAVRAKVESERRAAVAKSGRSVTLFINADVDDEKTMLDLGTEIDVLCRFNHIYWDAMSSRQFVGDMLRRVGEAWDQHSDPIIPSFKWGTEITNLSEPILDSLKVDIEALGDDIEKTCEEFIASLMKVGSSWGLTVQNSIGAPRTEFYNFSKAESAAMIRAVRSRVGPQYTISHLGHAAMVLALLKARPLPSNAPEDTQLISPLPVNGRRYLRDELADRQYGSCQSGAIVEFPNLKSWVVVESDTDAVRAMLERGCRHVKDGYDYWLSKEFQVAVNVSKDNFLAPSLSGPPRPFKDSNIPVFASDGLVDRYVPAEVVSPSGEKIMTVENCIFMLDTYSTDIIVRMDSFKGATSLSIAFNDGHFSSEKAVAFLHYVANFMLKIV